MPNKPQPSQRDADATLKIPHQEIPGGPGSLEAAMEQEKNPVKRFLRVLGPGFITGASDDDPSGIGTYAQAGASLGFSTLWTALSTFPLMTSVQYICGKVGIVSGMGLAGVLRNTIRGSCSIRLLRVLSLPMSSMPE